jgi:hypothetical protein
MQIVFLFAPEGKLVSYEIKELFYRTLTFVGGELVVATVTVSADSLIGNVSEAPFNAVVDADLADRA